MFGQVDISRSPHPVYPRTPRALCRWISPLSRRTVRAHGEHLLRGGARLSTPGGRRRRAWPRSTSRPASRAATTNVISTRPSGLPYPSATRSVLSEMACADEWRERNRDSYPYRGTLPLPYARGRGRPRAVWRRKRISWSGHTILHTALHPTHMRRKRKRPRGQGRCPTRRVLRLHRAHGIN